MAENQLIVSFTHTNYLIKNGGTEKCVSELSGTLRNDGFCHLSFYPFMKRKTVAGKPIVGVNYNDKFVGVVWTENIPKTIQYYLKKYNLSLNSFHIHHLKRHNVPEVLSAIRAFTADVYLFVHDFRFICVSEHFIDSKGRFCGDSNPDKVKCSDCAYYQDEINHQKMMVNFIETLQNRIKGVICPSEYVKNVMKRTYPELEQKIYVRPHLSFDGERTLEPVDHIRMAFPGRKRDQKGYDKWTELLNCIQKTAPYEYYYLGIDIEDDKHVHNIFVSTTTQGPDAMKNAIAENGINCAFVWPQCPETYSYVYYELLMSGVFIITNSISGNIRDEVISKGNGHVFETLEDCIDWLNDGDSVTKEIFNYRNNTVIPKSYSTNKDIGMLISPNAVADGTNIKAQKSLLPLSTLLYKIKYLKYRV